jgi:hypothetical protein
MANRLLLGLVLAQGAGAYDLTSARLEPHTVAAFDRYVKQREAKMRPEAADWCQARSGCEGAVRSDGVYVEPYGGRGLTDVRGGLIHDWSGATFIPGTTLDATLALLRNYGNHKNLFQPEVVDSRVITNQGDDYKVYLKLRKKKILTVMLNTEYDVVYRKVDGKRAYSRSYSTKIAELDDDGRELPVGNDHGFMWRLYAYWRFEERNGGVWVECETISLSRGVPSLLSGLISPIVKSLPRESLEKTLLAARQALAKK